MGGYGCGLTQNYEFADTDARVQTVRDGTHSTANWIIDANVITIIRDRIWLAIVLKFECFLYVFDETAFVHCSERSRLPHRHLTWKAENLNPPPPHPSVVQSRRPGSHVVVIIMHIVYSKYKRNVSERYNNNGINVNLVHDEAPPELYSKYLQLINGSLF